MSLNFRTTVCKTEKNIFGIIYLSGPWVHRCAFKIHIQNLILAPVIIQSNICHFWDYVTESNLLEKLVQSNKFCVKYAGSERVIS